MKIDQDSFLKIPLIDINLLEPFVNGLCNEAKTDTEIGLCNGLMGKVIFLYHYAKLSENTNYREIADSLIDRVYDRVSSQSISFKYRDGLAGVGVGIEYLIQEKLLEGNSDKILHDVDFILRQIIRSRSASSFSIRDICGLGYYYYYRLKDKNPTDDSIDNLRNKESLIYLIDWIYDSLKLSSYDDINNLYFFLLKIYSLDVYNFKVKQILVYSLPKLVSPNINDNYKNLGVSSLKLLKYWM